MWQHYPQEPQQNESPDSHQTDGDFIHWKDRSIASIQNQNVTNIQNIYQTEIYKKTKSNRIDWRIGTQQKYLENKTSTYKRKKNYLKKDTKAAACNKNQTKRKKTGRIKANIFSKQWSADHNIQDAHYWKCNKCTYLYLNMKMFLYHAQILLPVIKNQHIQSK